MGIYFLFFKSLAQVVFGAGAEVGVGVQIYGRCSIGERTRIEGPTVIRDCTVGPDCIIKPFCHFEVCSKFRVFRFSSYTKLQTSFKTLSNPSATSRFIQFFGF